MTGGTRPVGWRCRVCGTFVDVSVALSWRCPNSTEDDRRHVMTLVGVTTPQLTAPPVSVPPVTAPPVTAPPGSLTQRTQVSSPPASVSQNPFVTYDDRFAWSAFAEAHGIQAPARRVLVERVDAALVSIEGSGFVPTAFGRSDELSEALGFSDEGGLWVKDETGGVGGSQKARHLHSILLHLLVAEQVGLLQGRPPLAIASCGNAAIAAATLAKSADWAIEVYVPTWMSEAFGQRIESLGATIHRCERRSGDAAGDPAMLRFREAVADGAVPFTVQGPENAWCLDGGRTLGWEVVDQWPNAVGDRSLRDLDRVVIQVGGGAFATSVGSALVETMPSPPSVQAAQTAGCAPFARAWQRSIERFGAVHTAVVAGHWAELMTPWDSPASLADGIIDDETYDWLGVVAALDATGGAPVVVEEPAVARANQLATDAGYRVSATGSAGLAGLLQTGRRDADERVAVVFSGVSR